MTVRQKDEKKKYRNLPFLLGIIFKKDFNTYAVQVFS